VVIVLELAAVIMHVFSGRADADAPHEPANYSNTKALGKLLYTEYVYPVRDRRGDPAGGHRRGHRAHAARSARTAKYNDPSRRCGCVPPTACGW
jgi:hypothetical protein